MLVFTSVDLMNHTGGHCITPDDYWICDPWHMCHNERMLKMYVSECEDVSARDRLSNNATGEGRAPRSDLGYPGEKGESRWRASERDRVGTLSRSLAIGEALWQGLAF